MIGWRWYVRFPDGDYAPVDETFKTLAECCCDSMELYGYPADCIGISKVNDENGCITVLFDDPPSKIFTIDDDDDEF